jgi:hypothetical protein
VPDILNSAEWRKSSRSNGSGGNCVEIADNLPGIVAVRDSKNPDGPALAFSRDRWNAFLGNIKEGHFDL